MRCILFAVSLSHCSVDDIIDHYKKEQIVEGYNLKEPVSVQVSRNGNVLISPQLDIVLFNFLKWLTACFFYSL